MLFPYFRLLQIFVCYFIFRVLLHVFREGWSFVTFPMGFSGSRLNDNRSLPRLVRPIFASGKRQARCLRLAFSLPWNHPLPTIYVRLLYESRVKLDVSRRVSVLECSRTSTKASNEYRRRLLYRYVSSSFPVGQEWGLNICRLCPIVINSCLSIEMLSIIS